MKRRLGAALAAVLGGALLAAAGALPLVRSEHARLIRSRHLGRGETELRTENPAGAGLTLRRAGSSLDEATVVPLTGSSAWLPEGRYFVDAALGEARLLFPIVLGLGRPPEEDGTWPVTIRRPSPERPPRLHPEAPDFVYVPGGYFVMGDRHNPGQPHAVWVHSFHIASFEVTNREFRAFLADPGGDADPSSWTAAGWGWRSQAHSQATARLRPSDPRFPRFGRDDLPVMLVTWFEANAYCRWLTRRIGGGRWLYRLPTDAEWEKAARGPDAFDYGLGMELSEPQAELYNWRKNPSAEVTLLGFEETRVRYRANRYGVYHASGNAREWTQSVFRHYNAEHPYREDDRNADDAAGMRVTRGGSWYSASAVRLQLAYREEFQPELSSDDLGFRVAAILGAGGGPE
ncbi:MAG TPA: SUMF1/EgtB/PvdO family nonheme iron enzyme [Vicinamibacteria bacterium]|nr:SUMF1/EgtB/PvdO family nonheme iron enzyme [Vicinamibacteria bacterium]